MLTGFLEMLTGMLGGGAGSTADLANDSQAGGALTPEELLRLKQQQELTAPPPQGAPPPQ
jgi:hypothetical protein